MNGLSPHDERDHHVYIMATLGREWEISSPCKIGISHNPSNRLKQVQADCEQRIVLVAKFPFWCRQHALMVEKAFHKACAGYRLHGEWFDMSPADAVGVMTESLRSFIRDVLGATDTAEYYDASQYLSVPGFNYLIEIDTFGYRQ